MHGPSDRQERLAKALRENLRRRKAGGRQPEKPASPADAEAGEAQTQEQRDGAPADRARHKP